MPSTRFSRGLNDLKNQEHIRSLAVALVDLKHGYTMEFSTSPSGHREEYDEMERALRSSMTVNRVRLVRTHT